MRGVIDEAIVVTMVLLAVAGLLVGVALALGLPYLWAWLKPLLHALTA